MHIFNPSTREAEHADLSSRLRRKPCLGKKERIIGKIRCCQAGGTLPASDLYPHNEEGQGMCHFLCASRQSDLH